MLKLISFSRDDIKMHLKSLFMNLTKCHFYNFPGFYLYMNPNCKLIALSEFSHLKLAGKDYYDSFNNNRFLRYKSVLFSDKAGVLGILFP